MSDNNYTAEEHQTAVEEQAEWERLDSILGQSHEAWSPEDDDE